MPLLYFLTAASMAGIGLTTDNSLLQIGGWTLGLVNLGLATMAIAAVVWYRQRADFGRPEPG